MPRQDRTAYNEYMAEYMLRRYHERKRWAHEKLGGRCDWCGTTDDLEIDHIDRMTKAFSISKMWSVSKARFEEELMKCHLLCHTHHLEKSRACGDFKPKAIAGV